MWLDLIETVLKTTSLRRPCRLQEGRRCVGLFKGKLVVRIPVGQQAGHACPNSTLALEEPVALLVIAWAQTGTMLQPA